MFCAAHRGAPPLCFFRNLLLEFFLLLFQIYIQEEKAMKSYTQVIEELSARKDEKYRQFNERIVNIPTGTSIGVRMPALRTYGRELVRGADFDLGALFEFPDTVYEVRLLKCFAVGYGKMPFGEKVLWIRRAVGIVDGWAVCDLFCSTLKEIKKHRSEFLPELERYVAEGSEFSQRFAYVMLLGCYMEEEYLPAVFSLLRRAQTQYYYTHMGAAWLVAEVLVKFFDAGVSFLQEGVLDAKMENKAIQKACESYRLSDGQKKYLKSLKKR